MADFLSRLAERTLSARPAIRADLSAQHRPPPVFDPAEVPSTPDPDSPLNPTAERQQPQTTATQPQFRESGWMQDLRGAETQPPRVAPAVAPGPEAPLPRARAPGLAGEPRRVDSMVRDADSGGDVVRAARKIEESAPWAGVAQVPKASSATQDPGQAAATKHVVHDRGPTVPARPVPLPARVTTLTRAAPVHALDRVNGPGPLIESRPPAVHVSIGRIDVRAVMPPAAPAPPPERRTSTGMTLDAYLRERNRGRV